MDRNGMLLMKLIAGTLGHDHDGCKDYKRVHIRPLSDNEKDDLKSMEAESSRLCELRRKLSEEHDALMARRELFWHKVKKTLGQKMVPYLQIDDADENLLEVIHPETNPVDESEIEG